MEKQGIIKKEDFIKSIKEYKGPSFVKEDKNRKYSLEGYLFPDTYEFFKGMQGDKIIDKMLDRFNYVIKEIEKENNIKIKDEDMDKLISMASVIEKEAEKDDERGKVASVFYNRIDKKMKMESCATVLYALGYHKDKLYYKDLKIKSPYNTYLNTGLPIGPICSPGKNSIKAALNPEKQIICILFLKIMELTFLQRTITIFKGEKRNSRRLIYFAAGDLLYFKIKRSPYVLLILNWR